jgi:flagellar biosynthetic protein FliQ
MHSQDIVVIARDALWTLVKLSMPPLLTALVVGLIISIFQAATQIQEATLSFVPKMLAIFAVLLMTSSFMGREMNQLTQSLVERIVTPSSE